MAYYVSHKLWHWKQEDALYTYLSIKRNHTSCSITVIFLLTLKVKRISS